MASQLGAVTVSAVPDEQSGEVGGLQNTGTQLGASLGTALAGAVMISALTASFFAGIQNNPDVPANLTTKAQTELASGVPFVSDKDLKAALDEANVPPATATRSSRPTHRPGSTGCALHCSSWRSSRCSRCSSRAASRRSSPAPNPNPRSVADVGPRVA